MSRKAQVVYIKSDPSDPNDNGPHVYINPDFITRLVGYAGNSTFAIMSLTFVVGGVWACIWWLLFQLFHITTAILGFRYSIPHTDKCKYGDTNANFGIDT